MNATVARSKCLLCKEALEKTWTGHAWVAHIFACRRSVFLVFIGSEALDCGVRFLIAVEKSITYKSHRAIEQKTQLI